MGNKPGSVAAADGSPTNQQQQQDEHLVSARSTQPRASETLKSPNAQEANDEASRVELAATETDDLAANSPADTQQPMESTESIAGNQAHSLLKPAFDKRTSTAHAAGSPTASALPSITGVPMAAREKRDSIGSGPSSLVHRAAFENDVQSK
jgi:hypothetical protein